MGSSQSKDPPSTNDNEQLQDAASTVETKKASPTKPATKKERTGMDLVNYECRNDKRTYNKCVKKWYTKGFITGEVESLNQEEACGDLFDNYRQCILRGIRREYWEKEGRPPPDESSPLAEVDDDDDVKP